MQRGLVVNFKFKSTIRLLSYTEKTALVCIQPGFVQANNC